MATKEQIAEIMQKFVDRVNEVGPDCAKGWGGSLQVYIPDLDTGWLVKLAMDGTVESWDEKVDEETADSILEATSDTFLDVWEKRLPGMEAFALNKLKVRKSVDVLLKLSPAILM